MSLVSELQQINDVHTHTAEIEVGSVVQVFGKNVRNSIIHLYMDDTIPYTTAPSVAQAVKKCKCKNFCALQHILLTFEQKNKNKMPAVF